MDRPTFHAGDCSADLGAAREAAEGWRVVVAPDADRRLVAAQVVDTVGDRLAVLAPASFAAHPCTPNRIRAASSPQTARRETTSCTPCTACDRSSASPSRQRRGRPQTDNFAPAGWITIAPPDRGGLIVCVDLYPAGGWITGRAPLKAVFGTVFPRRGELGSSIHRADRLPRRRAPPAPCQPRSKRLPHQEPEAVCRQPDGQPVLVSAQMKQEQLFAHRTGIQAKGPSKRLAF